MTAPSLRSKTHPPRVLPALSSRRGPGLAAALLASAVAVATACGGGSGGDSKDTGTGDGDTGNGGGDGDGSSGDGDDNSDIVVGDGDTTPDGVICDSVSGDRDGDGFTIEEGDCNDCDVNANPGALDVPGNDVDENCDNIPDNQDACDGEVTVYNSMDALEAARSLGLCAEATADNRKWGVISAKYTLADGSDLYGNAQNGHALIADFGAKIVPREGDHLVSLSTGIATAVTEDDPSYYTRGGNTHLTSVSPPDGFPMASDLCPDVVLSETPRANDSMTLELEVRAPTNAKSLSFDFNFFTYEFPDFVCDDFNDNFIVLMDPPPEGALNGNIAFDNKSNPISVNSAFLEVCDAAEAGLDEYTCPQGAADLEGTGYELTSAARTTEGGATGWLSTTVPVEPGSTFTLKFIIWDAGENWVGGDGNLMLVTDHTNDATVLLDNFQFSAEEASGTITKHIAL